MFAKVWRLATSLFRTDTAWTAIDLKQGVTHDKNSHLRKECRRCYLVRKSSHTPTPAEKGWPCKDKEGGVG